MTNSSKISWLYKFWAYVFARPQLIKINKLLFALSLRGLGVLNTKYLSGEKKWLESYLNIKYKHIFTDYL